MAFYEQFLDQTKFGSYEDYLKNFHVNVPENFNYAFDVLDKIAETEPDRVALVWEHVDGREKTLTFGDIAKNPIKRPARCKKWASTRATP